MALSLTLSLSLSLSLTLASAPVARADLAVAASCDRVPLALEIDRAAAAAALPTFVGVNQICALQALLATTGDLPGSRVVDGRFDRQTRDALKAFQTAKALSSNGLLTPETMDALASAALDRIYAADEGSPLGAPETSEAPATGTAAAVLTPAQTAPAPAAQDSTAATSGLAMDGSATDELSATDRQKAVEAFLAATAATGDGGVDSLLSDRTLSQTSDPSQTSAASQTSTASQTSAATLSPESVPLRPDPLRNAFVSDFVEPSICHDPRLVQDQDLLRNLTRLPAGACLRVFEGAGNLPYRIYSLEASDGGPTLLVSHDGDDFAFDAGVAALNLFGGRLVVMQSGERTQTTALGANPEILGVSPALNVGCEWSDEEKPLAFAVHDYLVAGAAPILVLRANETQQSVLDRFSNGKLRFTLAELGPTREVFSPSIEPLADEAFLELAVTSTTRRTADTRALVDAGTGAGLPVALTLVDALGNWDQCSIEALALQTDQPVMRLLLGRARAERAEAVVAAAVAAAGLPPAPLQSSGSLASETAGSAEGRARGLENAIPADVLALAAGGLDAALDDNLSSPAEAQPRTVTEALAPGLPPLPLDRPSQDRDDGLLATADPATDLAPTNRVVTGIAAGTGVDALAPVAVAGADGFTLTATVTLGGEGVIVEEAVGPVLATPPNPVLRPLSDLPHRLVPDDMDPILAMLGEEYYRLQGFGTGVAPGQRILSGTQYYDPNSAPRVISSRTLSSGLPSGYTAPVVQGGYTNLPAGTITTTPTVNGPLYGNTLARPGTQQPGVPAYSPVSPGTPGAETVIINNSLY